MASGERETAVAAALGRHRLTIWRFLLKAGGLAPRPSTRSHLRLSDAEREEISRGLRAGESVRHIARRLGRAPSTVSREVVAHGGRRRYRAAQADTNTLRRAHRPRLAKLARRPRLRRKVGALLGERRSPQQIAARLRHVRVPPGYPADHPLADLFRYKDVVFGRSLNEDEVYSTALPDVVADAYAAALPVFRLLATLRG